MAPLIVDWTANVHVVRFSPTSEVLFYEPHPKAERPAFWYSEDDVEAMRKDYKRHAYETQKRLSSLPSEAVGAEEFDVFGIENLMSKKLVQKRVLFRRLVVHSVLKEQARQHLSEYNPDLLARVASSRTKWARERAQVIGLLQHQTA